MSHVYDRLDPEDWDGTSCVVTKGPCPNEAGDWLRFNSTGGYGNGVLLGHDWENFEMTCTAKQINGGGFNDYVIVRFRGGAGMGADNSTPPTGRIGYRPADSDLYMVNNVGIVYSAIGTGFDPTVKHTLRLYVNGSRVILQVNGIVLLDVDNFPSGNGGGFGFENLDALNDVYIKDLLIMPASLSTIRDLVTVEVGNRRFLCEEVHKYKFSEFTLGGTTNPTNIGTEDDPHIDLYDDELGGVIYSGISSGYTDIKLKENIIIKAELALMPDFSVTGNWSGVFLSWGDAGTYNYTNFVHDISANTRKDYILLRKGAISILKQTTPGFNNDGIYRELSIAKYNDWRAIKYQNKIVEMECPALSQMGDASQTTGQFNFRVGHDGGGEIAHARIKNMYIYKIIAEARP